MSDDDDDNEALVPRAHALLGLKFEDAEDRKLVGKVALACCGIVVCTMFLFFIQIIHRGHPGHAFGHLLIALALPAIGYYGVKKESSCLIWFFHLAAIQFAIFHFVVAIILVYLVSQLEEHTPQQVCLAVGDGYRSQFPEQFSDCVESVRKYQEHAPWLLFWWAVTTAPLWALQMYAAYQAQEYYFRLRVRRLITRPGSATGNMATVTEAESLRHDDTVE
eukprot:gnl/TRDRNA2_/TRDRNA2_40564_c0_seq1.p1 gnl/TRDRNA2_/TRDRNA2_40564_c0~~gnl/TRDRNA2_/TRDRNA2_40564_c0_seq1.p1  ORF type:complete len:220 (-),score=27.44 gnl/TRDRNA2_/TRDRNA2_40564_c0_seq1:143-802(-)